jgi:hypothetical protein
VGFGTRKCETPQAEVCATYSGASTFQSLTSTK